MFELILNAFSIVLQIAVAVGGVRLLMFQYPTPYWTVGWTFYTAAHILIVLRRGVVFVMNVRDYAGDCPNILKEIGLFQISLTTEYMLQVLISICFLLCTHFLGSMYQRFIKSEHK